MIARIVPGFVLCRGEVRDREEGAIDKGGRGKMW